LGEVEAVRILAGQREKPVRGREGRSQEEMIILGTDATSEGASIILRVGRGGGDESRQK
jgi:hypothetical protein